MSDCLTGDLEDGGASDGSVVADLLASGKDNVLLAVKALGNLDGHLDWVVNTLKMERSATGQLRRSECNNLQRHSQGS